MSDTIHLTDGEYDYHSVLRPLPGTIALIDHHGSKELPCDIPQEMDVAHSKVLGICGDEQHLYVFVRKRSPGSNAGSCCVRCVDLETNEQLPWFPLPTFTHLDDFTHHACVFKASLFYVHDGGLASLNLRPGEANQPLPRPLWRIEVDAKLLLVGERLFVLHRQNSQTILLESDRQWEPICSPPSDITACCFLSQSHAAKLMGDSQPSAFESVDSLPREEDPSYDPLDFP